MSETREAGRPEASSGELGASSGELDLGLSSGELDPFTAGSSVADAPLRWQRDPVELWGRSFPRATGAERLFMATCALAAAVVLGLALWLQPDVRGIGTHEQLGLPACGVAVALGMPCPSCGFTTTFALAAKGHLWSAIKNQPFGFVLFLGTVISVPLLGVGAAKGISWLDLTVHWPWWRICGLAFSGWMAGWAYKYWMMP